LIKINDFFDILCQKPALFDTIFKTFTPKKRLLERIPQHGSFDSRFIFKRANVIFISISA